VIGFLVSLTASLAATLLLVRSASLHASRTGDRDFTKPQKVHTSPVPRVGGLAVVLGLLAWIGSDWAQGYAVGPAALLMACAAPAFVAGFVQDCTEAVTPRGRLLATGVSAVLAFYGLDAAIRDTDIPGLDWLVAVPAGALLVTVVAVAGIANAINIIDGFNGLASMCVALILAGLAYVAFQVGDPLIGNLALAGIGAVLGFFLWNFPAGLIFLGDGGAYFLGFFVSEVSILLLVRNPGEVSPLFPLLACFYPVFETLFSIYRRRFLRATPPHLPDGIHLHSLVYRRILIRAVGDRSAKALTRRNSMTAPYLWVLCTLSVIPGVLFWNNTAILAAFLLIFAITYIALYWRIVRFKSPRWMVFRPSSRRAPPLPADN
jgi:UDP-N-acetylmuramyl pentapeptide phosphotransferase/UDP-N-acetylglucosamine-1-phosphate transferase